MSIAAPLLPEVAMCPDPYTLAQDCDALILMTEWNEFRALDLERIRASMKTPILFDGRNVYDPETMSAFGFQYRGFGRGYNGSRKTDETEKARG